MSSSTVSEDESLIVTDPAKVFAESLVTQVNRDDVVNMVHLQRDMLSRFEKTNEMLINFNMLSTARYEITCQEFKKHTTLLFDMKKDLDTVFKRIRVLKQRLGKMYPEAFTVCSDVYNFIENEEDNEKETAAKSPTDTPKTPTGTPRTPTGMSKTPTGAPKTPTGTPKTPTETVKSPTGTTKSLSQTSKTQSCPPNPPKETLKTLSEIVDTQNESSKATAESTKSTAQTGE